MLSACGEQNLQIVIDYLCSHITSEEGISNKISYAQNGFQPTMGTQTPSLMHITKIKWTCDSRTPDRPVPSGRNYLIVSIIENIHLIGMPPCASGITDVKDSAVLLLLHQEAAFARVQALCPSVCMAVQFHKSSLVKQTETTDSLMDRFQIMISEDLFGPTSGTNQQQGPFGKSLPLSPSFFSITERKQPCHLPTAFPSHVTAFSKTA